MRKPLAVFLFLALAFAACICAPIAIPGLKAGAQTPQSEPAPPPPANFALAAQQAAPQGTDLTIVIDAAHGGVDNGARGPNGVNEKDVSLALARGIRAELTRRGFRVVMTRDADTDPAFDDRAATANQFADAIYISLHVASTGTAGTVRAYFYRIATPFATIVPAAGVETNSQPTTPTPSPPGGLVPWREAQAAFDDGSHRFADAVQAGLAQKFSGSPATGTSAAVRDLRSVAAPAISIELSSVASLNASSLEAMGPSVASAIAQGILEFHPFGMPGGSAATSPSVPGILVPSPAGPAGGGTH